ncbi:hypothetical protein GJAV_G00005370 [Gymnothorax javanicus]|nr:hypothetical protein GJAV_G00005370 [Gymnothorax javanicus]
MLELQNTRTGDDLPTKTYRCVACAATFPGLSSLLVHQASHANDSDPLEKPQPPPSSQGDPCTHCNMMFASKELMAEHHCEGFAISSSSFTCECGEFFQDHGALTDHKMLHNQGTDLQVQDCSIDEGNKCKTKASILNPFNQTDQSTCLYSDSVPTGSDSAPTASDSAPTASDSAPTASDSVHTASDSVSSGSDSAPSGSDSALTGSEFVPRGSDSVPSSSGSGPNDLLLIPLQTGTETAPENGGEDFPVPSLPLSHDTEVPSVSGQLLIASASQPVGLGALPAFTVPQDQPSLTNITGSPPNVPTSSSSFAISQPQDFQQPKKSLKKMPFSEFMKRLPPAQISWNHTEGSTFSENTLSTVAGAEAGSVSSSGSSVRQLRRLLAKSDAKRKAFSQASAILNLISTSKQQPKTPSYIVSLNRTFLPIVALVTRQKLLGSGRNGMEGRHQCGRCWKIFQDVDSLILHHAMHRKERISGCHQCRHLLIGKLAVPEGHICPPTSMLSPGEIFSVGILLSSPSSSNAHPYRSVNMVANPLQRSTPIPSAKNNFHCLLCNQSYTRLYGLKQHKCPEKASTVKPAESHNEDGVLFPADERDEMRADRGRKPIEKQNEKARDQLSLTHKSIGVGTAGLQGIKLEDFNLESVAGVISPHCQLAESPHTGVNCSPPNTAKGIPSKLNRNCDFSTQGLATVLPVDLEEEKREGNMTKSCEPSGAGNGKWTMPIGDSEMDLLIEADCAVDDNEGEEDLMESLVEKPIDGTHNLNSSQNLPFQGVKCFSCSYCGRSYTRRFTLRQHQKKCHLAVRPSTQQNIRKALKVSKVWEGKPSFNCLRCGRSFCYRDTLVLHQKNCQPRNGRGDGNGDHTLKKDNGMQLGQGHLARQGRAVLLPPSSLAKACKGPEKRAQAAGGDWGIMSLPSVLPRRVTCECGEGFTCPRLLFEHLQLHAQESYICPDCGEDLPSWPVFEAHLRKHQRLACLSCNQTFSQRASLVRHIKKNRCPGKPIKEKVCCPHCKLEFPNGQSLKLHLQGPPCKVSHQLIQCPVCANSFDGVEGLQKHLMTHSNSNAFHCQLCQRSYPSLRSLKDHRRKVHRALKSFGPGRAAGVPL